MRLKPDWSTYLHDYRHREFQLIFARVPPGTFPKALELGAGDGYQSRLLAPLTKKLISTDYSPLVQKNEAGLNLSYQVCDAEEVDSQFPPRSFDLVFSSSLLEHVSRPQKVLRGVHAVLKDDGIAVHIMPTTFWKLAWMTTYYPNLLLTTLQLLSGQQARKILSREIHHQSELEGQYFENNQKIWRRRIPFLRHLFPPPHGVSRHHIQEFWAFSQRRWLKEFEMVGFTIIKIIAGPVASGNGLGWRRLARWLERLGQTSVYAYVTVKTGHQSRFSQLF